VLFPSCWYSRTVPSRQQAGPPAGGGRTAAGCTAHSKENAGKFVEKTDVARDAPRSLGQPASRPSARTVERPVDAIGKADGDGRDIRRADRQGRRSVLYSARNKSLRSSDGSSSRGRRESYQTFSHAVSRVALVGHRIGNGDILARMVAVVRYLQVADDEVGPRNRWTWIGVR